MKMERKKYHPSSPTHRPAPPAVTLRLPRKGNPRHPHRCCFRGGAWKHPPLPLFLILVSRIRFLISLRERILCIFVLLLENYFFF